MNKRSAKLREEFVALLPPTIFFFVMLNLVALIRALMLKGTGIALSTPIQIAVGALVLGKAVLLADMLPLINRYPDKPLAYNIAWKTCAYALMALFIHCLEHLVDFCGETGSFLAGNEQLLAKIIWPHFWAIQIVLVILIFHYCVMHELGRVTGAARLQEIFFGPLASPGARRA